MTIFMAVSAVVIAGLFWRRYYGRRERNLLYRLEKMIQKAEQGELERTEVSENEFSALENGLRRFLENSQLSARSQKRQKDLVHGLISDIAHQTLTPITNLKMYAELLGEVEVQNRELTETLRGQADKLDFLIRSLVKLSRMESGLIHVHPGVASVSQLFQRLWQDYSGTAQEKGVTLHMAATQLQAVFDMKWTQEAVGNLVDNAIKYTPAGGQVEMEAKAYSFFIRLDIRDTGIGIPREEIGRVFGRFYRGLPAQDYPGVGIGLYLAREIIQAQKGYIKASSREGEGSVFSVFLPTAAPILSTL
ncbi:MAG: HAMP domain-containing histidine kinase [Lachnospiraceae bacterium]|nr:HAMP domain-containing histidine kinase [Lachnospiraceae bacterium]